MNIINPISSVGSPSNLLVNSGFDYWFAQGTSKTIANGVDTYVPDMWFGHNAIGGAGVITVSQLTGAVDTSVYGCSVKVTTAGSGGSFALVQMLDNLDTVSLLNKTVSLSCRVKALGNVNAINIALVSATSAIKSTTPFASSANLSINSSGFTLCTFNNVLVNSSFPTTAGVIGVMINIAGVSSGNYYDLNNGFVVEQVMMNVGSTVQPFARQGLSRVQELQLCQRHFYSTFANNTAPVQGGLPPGMFTFAETGAASGGGQYFFQLPIQMRAVPTVTFYNPGNGNSQVRRGSSDFTLTVSNGTTDKQIGFTATADASGGAGSTCQVHFTADARI